MRLTWKMRTPGRIEFGIIYGSIAVAGILVARALPVLEFMPACVFRSLTGLPCPTCGSTRALVHLSHGDLSQAFGLNPLFAAAVIAALLAMAVNAAQLLFRAPYPELSATNTEASVLRAVAALLFLLNWSYLLVAMT